jgi:hypothetical protein
LRECEINNLNLGPDCITEKRDTIFVYLLSCVYYASKKKVLNDHEWAGWLEWREIALGMEL